VKRDTLDPLFFTYSLRIERFSEFPLAKQELPRQITISVEFLSEDMVDPLIVATRQAARQI
jgi:hypothetical protein